MFNTIRKRDGRSVPYDLSKISTAIEKAMSASSRGNVDESVKLAAEVEQRLIARYADGAPDIETIQDEVEAVLMEKGYPLVAKRYILYRADRSRTRERNTRLMRTLDELTFQDAKVSNMKRDNANIDGDTAMGTMLKYGSESAKEYYEKYVLSQEQSDAHNNGDIHIHDFDFYTLTTTCITPDTNVVIRKDGKVRVAHAREFDGLFAGQGQECVYPEGYEILSRDGFVDVINCARRPHRGKIYSIRTKTGELMLTGNHIVPTDNGEKSACFLRPGDTLESPRTGISAHIGARMDEINLLDWFGASDAFTIENTDEIRRIIKERHLSAKVYQAIGYPKYQRRFTLKEFCAFNDIVGMDLHDVRIRYKQSRNGSLPVMLPLTKELGKFMGYVYSEGSIGNHWVTFTNSDKGLLDDFERVCGELFGDARLSVFDHSTSENCVQMQLNGNNYRMLFDGPLGVKKSTYDMLLPAWIYTANMDFLSGFLGAYIDGDGSVDKKAYQVVIASSCEAMTAGLQYLLKTLGVNSYVYRYRMQSDYAVFGDVVSERKGMSSSVKICGSNVADITWIDSNKLRNNYSVNQYNKRRDAMIREIEQSDYDGFVYDFETSDHYFSANGFIVHNCCQIDIKKLFSGGFSTGHGHLREPNSIHSYAALACIAIQSNQNDQHGGQSIPNFDYGLAPGVAKTYRKIYITNYIKGLRLLAPEAEITNDEVRGVFGQLEEGQGYRPRLLMNGEYKAAEAEAFSAATQGKVDATMIDRIHDFAVNAAEEETERETLQAMEALVHNLNTMHSRAGAQTPFSSINYGTDTTPEGRLVSRCVMLATESGMGGGETAIFPIHIFKVKEGVSYNEGDPNYDLFKLACRVSAKRLFPNFSFLDAPFNLKYYDPARPETEVSYMGCRTRVIGNSFDPESEIAYGRGNLSFTSVNLPRIAINAHGNIEWFFEELKRKMDLVTCQLLDRYRIQASKKVRNFPFLMGQGIWIGSDKLKLDDEVGEVLKHGTFSVGFIGLAEALVALVGNHHGQTSEARNLGIEIIGFMREYLDDLSLEKQLNFTLLATPAEGLAGRFVKLDRKKYGSIEGVTDRDYYTNGFHVPVYHPIAAFEKVRIEAPYHALTNAGHITYVELDGDPTNNLGAFESVVRAMKEAGIGYGSVNHPVDRDPVCGYNGIIDDVCPGCGRSEADSDMGFERIRRITGYLVGTLDRFNDAKRAEEADRVKHDI